MTEELKKILYKQFIPPQEQLNIVKDIFYSEVEGYNITVSILQVFNYGVIIGKQEERKRRKKRVDAI